MRRSGCRRATRWLHEKADGGLSRERALALDAHLAGCDACRGREAALAWVSGRLQRGQRPLPHGFWGRLQGRLAQESAEPLARESPVAWRWLPVAATLLLAVGLAVFGLLPRSRNAVPESPSVQVVLELTDVAARSVSVAGDFNDWQAAGMQKGADGVWRIRLSLRPGRYQYAFVVDDARWVADPRAATLVDSGYGGANSVIEVSL